MDDDWSALGTLPAAPGRLLVATPALEGPTFRRTVIYLLEHGPEGSLGVVLNRPSQSTVEEILPPWRDVVSRPSVIFQGGPVQQDGALCLGAVEGAHAGVRPLTDDIASIDLDGDVESLLGVARALRIFAGYAGWSPGQLAGELAEGSWWVVEGSVGDLFSGDPESMWARVLRRQPPPLAYVSTYPEDPERN